MTAPTKSARYFDTTANRSAASAPIADNAVTLPTNGTATVDTISTQVNALTVLVNKILAVQRTSGEVASN